MTTVLQRQALPALRLILPIAFVRSSMPVAPLEFELSTSYTPGCRGARGGSAGARGG